MFDITVIGAGIIGAMAARDLARYKLNVLLVDKEADVANGTTKANSAIIHAGYDPYPGTLKAKLNVEGNAMFDSLCSELDVPFKRIGSIVAAFSDDEMKMVEELYRRGLKNGVPGMRILGRDELHSMEPNINENAIGALYAETAGIVSPYELCIACVENAVENGVQLMTGTEVTDIEKCGDSFKLKTKKGVMETRFIVNAAGLFADKINCMLGGKNFEIIPRKGEYCLLDKNEGGTVKHVIFQTPTSKGKGVLVTPTVHGNLLLGPNSYAIDDKYDLSTTTEGLEEVIASAGKTTRSFSMRDVVTSFAGLRASTPGGDFIINVPVHNAVNAAAIDSPGLSSAPAISGMIVDLLRSQGLRLEEKEFNPVRKTIKRFADMDMYERAEAVRRNPLYGRVICRCETVTEGDIVNAIRRPAGAKTVDGIKRRLRAGMGRCQGGFCMPKVVEIVSRELNIPYADVVKDSEGSYILTGRLKDNYDGEEGGQHE